MRYISNYKEARGFSFGSGWDTNDDPMDKLDKINNASKVNSQLPLIKLPSALDYINKDKLHECWKDVQKHVLDLGQKGNRFKKVLTDPIWTNANFSGYYFVMYQNERDKCYDIGNVCVIFSIKNVNNLIIDPDGVNKPNSLNAIRTHPAYHDIVEAHEKMLTMMNLINEFRVNVFVGSALPTTKNEIYIQISYCGIENYIKFIDDQLSDPKSRTKYFSPHRLYEPIRKLVDSGRFTLSKNRFDLAPINRLRTLMDENPSVRFKNRPINKDEISRQFSTAIRLLIENGFKFKHIINDARKIDTLQAFKAGADRYPLFYLIAMTGLFKDIDLVSIDARMFLYNEAFPYFSLGSDILSPLFRYCLENTDILFELPEGTLAILYLIYNRKLLGTHLRKGNEISQWIDSITLNNKLLAQGLIINNKKAEARWVIDLLKGAPSKQSESAREALKQFRNDISSSLTLLKSRFEHSSLVEKGKFHEMPDFNYFRSLVIDLNGYL